MNLPADNLLPMADPLPFGDISESNTAQSLLAESEQEFRSLFELSAVGTIQLDARTHRFLRVNRKFCEITGYTPDELYEQTFSDITFPVDREADLRRYETLILGSEDRWQSEKRYLHKAGHPVWVQEDGTILRDQAGRALRSITAVQDITERKEREAERHYILQSARCLLWSSDITLQEDGRMEWTMRYFDEEAAQRLIPIDAPPGDPYVWKWHAMRLPEDREANYRTGDQCVRAGQDFELEFRMRDREGHIHWLREEVHVETLEPERRWRAVGVCTDITDQKQRQAEIEHLNERLRHAMSETHHRVKNNLQVIAAMLDMQHMEHEAVVPMAEVDRINHHIQALSTLHDLLTRQAKTDQENNAISVKKAIEMLMPMLQSMAAEERRLAFAIEDLRVPVRQSTTLVVLINELISNALKHGSGTVRVSFSVRSEEAELCVEDEGAGFPEGFDVRKNANTGLELVLSLARWDLNGQVRFENRVEGGARVRVLFPLASDAEREREPSGRMESGSSLKARPIER